MMEAIGAALLIILTLLGMWAKGADKRQEKKQYEDLQQGHKDVADGNVDAVSSRIDRLLTKARNRDQRSKDSETK